MDARPHTEHVLVVDDTPANRYVFRRTLEEAGYRVAEAAYGREVFTRLEREAPDLILLDVHLPDMSGLEVCRRLKQDSRHRHIPVIQTSANFTSAEDYSRGVECGADAYLTSPVDPLILLSNIRAWLRVKRLNEELQEGIAAQERGKKLLAETVEELSREKILRNQFVATLTHDMRNPLSTVRINLEIIRMKLRENAEVQRVVDVMESNMRRVGEMVDNMLDAQLLLSGRHLPIRTEDCSFSTILEQAVKDMAQLYGARFEIVGEEKPRGQCDPGALRRILDNLLTNAVKYGDPDAPIRVGLKEADGRVHISVHNQGTPIPEADQKLLFEPFSRSTVALEGNQKGWGLGLSIVKGLLESHAGTISVRSDAESGTTFTVDLPLGPAAHRA